MEEWETSVWEKQILHCGLQIVVFCNLTKDVWWLSSVNALQHASKSFFMWCKITCVCVYVSHVLEIVFPHYKF